MFTNCVILYVLKNPLQHQTCMRKTQSSRSDAGHAAVSVIFRKDLTRQSRSYNGGFSKPSWDVVQGAELVFIIILTISRHGIRVFFQIKTKNLKFKISILEIFKFDMSSLDFIYNPCKLKISNL